MNAFMVLWTALWGVASSVTALGVVPTADRTEVVIEVDEPAAIDDFTLSEPARIVIDLQGSTEALPRKRFTDIDRGGVRALRSSQFREDVVRVVVDLVEPVAYSIEHSDGAVRVSFPNPGGPFEPWSSESGAEIAPSGGDGPDSAADRDGTAPGAAGERSTPAGDVPAPADDAARAVADVSTPAADAAPRVDRAAQQQEPRITVYFTDTPIMDVLATFSEFSDRSIVAGPNIEGSITADIRNQPWDVALQAILSSHGLTAQEMPSGIIRVDADDQLRRMEQTEPLVTRTISVEYANVDSIFPAVEGLVCTLGQPGSITDSTQSADQLAFLAMQSAGGMGGDGCRGGVTRNRSTNALIVTATQSQMPGIVETIRDLDVRTPQVTISAKIIFVDRSALEGLGVSFDLKDSEGNQLNELTPGFIDRNNDGTFTSDEQTSDNVISLGGNSIGALANAASSLPSRTLQVVTSLVLNRHTLVSFIEALQENSFTDVQAAPVITTLDHRAARVHVGEETPVRVVDAGAGGGGGGGGAGGAPSFPRATVQFQETGVILEVTPHVVGDQVLLELHAERSAVGLAPSDIGVVFNTQESDTQILVDDGETAVIGGLTIIEQEQTRSGIPLLMDIPVLGALFSTTQQEESKQDLLIMVTPHIVRESQ